MPGSVRFVVMEAFPPTGGGVRSARRFVERHLQDRDLGSSDAALVVSELAANAVLHATTDFTVRVAVSDSLVRIEVADGSPLLPTPKDHGDGAPTGRGLKIVERLSARWGAEPTADGKVVWAELDPIDDLVDR